MAILKNVRVCQCDDCGHRWLPESDEMPRRCPSRKCRKATWNSVEGGVAVAPPAKRRTVFGRRPAVVHQPQVMAPVIDSKMRAAGDTEEEDNPRFDTTARAALEVQEMYPAVGGGILTMGHGPHLLVARGGEQGYCGGPGACGKCDGEEGGRQIVVDEYSDGYRPPVVVHQPTLVPPPSTNGSAAVDDEPLAVKLRRLGVTLGMPDGAE